jgi:hypothetical protein
MGDLNCLFKAKDSMNLVKRARSLNMGSNASIKSYDYISAKGGSWTAELFFGNIQF